MTDQEWDLLLFPVGVWMIGIDLRLVVGER
jgi:hypothetical protein